MREAWRLCFNKPMQGEKAPEPSRGQILPLEPWIHPYTHGDEEKWWDSVLNAFPARLGKGWEAKFEAVDCMEEYDALAGGFACSRPRDALGRDGLHDPALLEIMLERGSEAMESGFLLPGDLLSPEFPLHSAADVLLLAGYQISAAHALDWNRGTIAYNILAGYSNSLPEKARKTFLKNADPMREADLIKRDLETERNGDTTEWAWCWRGEIRRLCGLDPDGWEGMEQC